MLLYIILAIVAAAIGYGIDSSLLAGLPLLQNKLWAAIFFALLVPGAVYVARLLSRISRRRVVFVLLGAAVGKALSWFVLLLLQGYVQSLPQLLPTILDLVLVPAGIAYLLFQEQSLMGFSLDGLGSLGKRSANGHGQYKVLDTSVIIDGRIADIVETGFMDGIIVVPQFVLMELQQIADSPEAIKRSRGRRGLDILNRMKLSDNCVIKISDTDFPDVPEVDSKLIELTRLLKGDIITNDFNLNKIAELKGIKVLNINELSNALKPSVLPGEEMTVSIIKEGKDPNQGIAYLDDGTMIVVDQGKQFINKKIGVVVTSVFQTPAGRMIFTQPQKSATHS